MDSTLGPPSLCIFKIRLAITLVDGRDLAEKIIEDLSKFMHFPKTRSYCKRMAAKVLQEIGFALQKNNVSSTKRKCIHMDYVVSQNYLKELNIKSKVNNIYLIKQDIKRNSILWGTQYQIKSEQYIWLSKT